MSSATNTFPEYDTRWLPCPLPFCTDHRAKLIKPTASSPPPPYACVRIPRCTLVRCGDAQRLDVHLWSGLVKPGPDARPNAARKCGTWELLHHTTVNTRATYSIRPSLTRGDTTVYRTECKAVSCHKLVWFCTLTPFVHSRMPAVSCSCTLSLIGLAHVRRVVTRSRMQLIRIEEREISYGTTASRIASTHNTV